MNQNLLERWMEAADKEYRAAVTKNSVAMPRDTYVALWMEQRIKTYRIEKEHVARIKAQEEHNVERGYN